MGHKHTHTMAYVLLMILLGLLLSCGIEPLPSDDQSTPTPASLSAASAASASDPVLPRDFTLPVPLFAADSAWNQTVTAAAVLSASDAQILVTYRVLRGDNSDLHPAGPAPTPWPFMYLNYDEYSIPVFGAGQGQQSVLVCDYEGNLWWPSPRFGIDQQGGPVPVPGPAGTVRPAGPEGIEADGHLVLYVLDTFTTFDFWQATTVRDGECQSRGGGLTGVTILEAGAIDFFDVRGPGINPDTYSSARAVGTPLLAGLLLPEDVENGSIAHALAFAIPGLRNTSDDPYEPLPSDYFYPASTTETDFFSTNPHALAAGQRLRLKQTLVDEQGDPLDENQLAPITRMLLTALRTYGAYLVDNSGGFTFYAEDIHTAVLDLTDAEVNALIAAPPGAPLPAEKTKWQIVIEKLNQELEQIPFAYGPWQEGQNPADAEIDTANFEVVEPATRPITVTSTVHLPLALRDFSAPTTDLLAVNDFLYQLQNLDLSAISDTAYDLIVMDYSAGGDDATAFTYAQIAALQDSPGGEKTVLAYMSIGEAEDYRFYWQEDWDPDGDGQPDQGAPAWLDVENPDWEGNYKVHYWEPDWQAIIFRYIDRLLDAGFDGAHLDIIDAYEYYADQGRAAAAQEMADFVAAVRAYACDRDPDFYILVQNAPELANLVPTYLNSVDGIGQEDIYYGYEDDDVRTPPAVTAEMESHLDLFKNAGKLVLTVDYATTPAHIDDAYAKSLAKGYVPLVTVRDLDQLIINPGHEPD
jgi:cysteinyl-tRNA synthetase